MDTVANKETKVSNNEVQKSAMTGDELDSSKKETARPMDEIQVRVQDTPNPNAIKFIVNAPLKAEGKLTLTSQDQCLAHPLPYSLFDIAGVVQLYFFENTLTLTHEGQLPSNDIKEMAKAIFRTRLSMHDPYIESNEETAVAKKVVVDRTGLSPELQAIEEILDRTVRPGLQMDGGDVEVVEFSNNILKILYQGACGGCPSSMMGTLDYIQNILRHELTNEEIVVVPI